MARKKLSAETLAAMEKLEEDELAWINGWPRRALDIMYYLTQYADDIGLRYSPVRFDTVLRDGTIKYTIDNEDHEELSDESPDWECESIKRMIDDAKEVQDRKDERERRRREVIEKLTPEERELLGVRA